MILSKFLFETAVQKLNLANRNNDGTEERARAEGEIGNRKFVYMAVEVWVDVLGFVKRIQLARTVSLTSRHIHQICLPRLHGKKVVAHDVLNITISEGFEWRRQAARAILVTDGKEVPFPDSPLPEYITGFRHISIHFLDNQVLDFIGFISPRITTKRMRLLLNSFGEEHRASVNQLVDILSKDGFPQTNLVLGCPLAKIGYVPDGGNKMKTICLFVRDESEIANVIKFLAIPRPDGHQQVVTILPQTEARQHHLPQKILESIKQEFHSSTQPVAQPFYLVIFRANLNVPRSDDDNQQTNETLTITPMQNLDMHICRYPTGQHEKCESDAINRLKIVRPIHNETKISVNISKF